MFSLLLVMQTCVMKAQLDGLFNFNSSNQQLIQMTIENILVEVKQSYRLMEKETNQLYGRNGENEFGETHCPGIKVLNGLIVSDEVVKPWDYDSNFEKYKEKYTPVLYKTTIKDGQQTYIKDSVTVIRCMGQEYFSFITDSTSYAGGGLTVDCTCNNGEKDGWIVWFTKGSGKIDYSIIKKRLSFEEDKYVYDTDPLDTSMQVLGGIFIIPTSPSNGVLLMQLSGVLANVDGQWKIVRPDIPIQNEDKEDVTNTEGDEKSEVELTPIDVTDKQKAKRKKK